MKGKLIKHKFGYNLVDTNGEFIATSKDEYSNGINLKYWLSKQNCDEIFGVTDVEKLAEERFLGSDDITNYNLRFGFKEGFNKAMELNKDKMFTLEQVLDAFYAGWISKDKTYKDKIYPEAQKSYKGYLERHVMQPTEINVEIEMECKIGCDNFIFNGDKSICCGNKIKKLDSNGNLILRKFSYGK